MTPRERTYSRIRRESTEGVLRECDGRRVSRALKGGLKVREGVPTAEVVVDTFEHGSLLNPRRARAAQPILDQRGQELELRGDCTIFQQLEQLVLELGVVLRGGQRRHRLQIK